MSVCGNSMVLPANITSVVWTGTSRQSGHLEGNLAYEDLTRITKTSSYAAVNQSVTINFSTYFIASYLAVIGHNLHSAGHTTLTFSSQLTSGWAAFEGSATLAGDYDMILLSTSSTIDELTLDFGSSTSDGLFIGGIMCGGHVELDQNPTNGQYRGKEDYLIHQEVDAGNARHLSFGQSQQQSLEMQWRRGLTSDLKTLRDLPNGRMVGILPPLEHAASPWAPEEGSQFFGYKRSLAWAPVNTYGSAVKKHNIVMSLVGV
jgi:hypothetical protein